MILMVLFQERVIQMTRRLARHISHARMYPHRDSLSQWNTLQSPSSVSTQMHSHTYHSVVYFLCVYWHCCTVGRESMIVLLHKLLCTAGVIDWLVNPCIVVLDAADLLYPDPHYLQWMPKWKSKFYMCVFNRRNTATIILCGPFQRLGWCGGWSSGDLHLIDKMNRWSAVGNTCHVLWWKAIPAK